MNSMEGFDGMVRWSGSMEVFDRKSDGRVFKVQWKGLMEAFDGRVRWKCLMEGFDGTGSMEGFDGRV